DGRDRAAAARLVDGADAVFSCAGASVAMGLGHGWRGYGAVDPVVNRTLVDAAAASAARPRFVYVSVFHTPAMRGLAYIGAHERVVDALAASGLPHAIVRPTGFYSAIVPAYLGLVKRGSAPEIGDGTARTNPIGDDDLAGVCLEAIASAEPALAIDVGGPEVLPRRALVELAGAALGRTITVRRVPPWLARAGSAGLRLVHPRMGQFARFVAAISTLDLVAPARGTARLADAFAAAAGSLT
ncbi:MAG TPA: NAD(P)H-binding protein, partial [Kofleriaceae bacterium]|nr:NAD(P)H-binding protein [Kofleriaceae bacterium]